jgi:threonine aldolase
MNVIDLRSDTVTKPTAGMRRAIAEAEVGDDVFGDDPTVRRLQERVADLLGKEAALFVPSGTMGNQLALRAQTEPGQQIVCEAGAHLYHYEAGAPAALSGLLITCVHAPDHIMSWDMIAPVLNPVDVHFAPATLVCLENTHNRAGGRILPQSLADQIGRRAHERGLRVHLDGARLWNTHIATGLPLKELAAPADTVTVCFSKALGAPAGSVLAADGQTLARAHRFRKQWGGAMRQVGILAAACLYALDHHLGRLVADHEHARLLARSLDHPLLSVNHPVQTNIVIVDVAAPATAENLLAHLERKGVLAVAFGPGRIRMVPNLQVGRAELMRAVEALNSFAE